MVRTVFDFFLKIFRSRDIKKKIYITLLIVFFYRLLAHIPTPGIDTDLLRALFLQSPFLSLLDIFSGGTLANFSIMALGLGPYISASIILQLLTFVVPSLEELSKEGEYGQAKINYYTRILTVPISVFQSLAMYSLLREQNVVGYLSFFGILGLVITMTAGTMLSLWLGELITEYGLGDGVSFLIFAGIVARLPVTLTQAASLIKEEDILRLGVFVSLAFLIIALIVFMNESLRKIPVTYAKHTRIGYFGESYIPLRLNQAGVIPIIFAVSLVLLPSFIAQALRASGKKGLINLGTEIIFLFSPQSLFYNVFYFLLVVGFTYFYTSFVFNPERIAENLQKNGGFIPGIRPGSQTVNYLRFILNRITLVGALFLGLIAILPSLFQSFLGIANLAIGGTGVLIVVSVVVELTRNLEASLSMGRYEKFLKGER